MMGSMMDPRSYGLDLGLDLVVFEGAIVAESRSKYGVSSS